MVQKKKGKREEKPKGKKQKRRSVRSMLLVVVIFAFEHSKFECRLVSSVCRSRRFKKSLGLPKALPKKKVAQVARNTD